MKRILRRQLQHTWLITCIQSFLLPNLLDPRRNALIKIFYFRNWNHGPLLLTRSSKFLNIGWSSTWNSFFKSALNGSIILISGDTGGQSLSTQILELSTKEVTSLDLWNGAPSCWKILCASYIGNKSLFKTLSYPTEFIRSGHRMRIMVPVSFIAPQTIKR